MSNPTVSISVSVSPKMVPSMLKSTVPWKASDKRKMARLVLQKGTIDQVTIVAMHLSVSDVETFLKKRKRIDLQFAVKLLAALSGDDEFSEVRSKLLSAVLSARPDRLFDTSLVVSQGDNTLVWWPAGVLKRDEERLRYSDLVRHLEQTWSWSGPGYEDPPYARLLMKQPLVFEKLTSGCQVFVRKWSKLTWNPGPR